MLIGKRISGRYKIIRNIGGGGMANVYLAQDMILDREVAVKILRLDFSHEEEFIKRFQREAQSATSLVHPNIVNIFDVGEEDGIYYIVMEYVDGMTLKQYIHNYYPVSIEKSMDIMNQLTSAISHAHHHQIIHRDIKPHNILIDQNGTVKITDFGIAMALSSTSITQTNSVLGSVHYLSPEQARGGMATNKSDIYSLGIVMFELLAGRLPFSGESAVSIALKHLQSETPSVRRWNSSVPQSVENIIIKSTAKDPFHRYEDVDEMSLDIRTALNDGRIHEEKYVLPIDHDATKAIPVIKDHYPVENVEHTIVKEPVQPAQQGKKKRKKWPWILFSIFILFGIASVLAVTVLPDLLGPKEVSVPDLEGESLNEAYQKLVALNFEVGEEIEVTDEEIEEGSIVRTNPKSGSVVKEGEIIDLYISSGKEKYTMTELIGLSEQNAKRLLLSAGFLDENIVIESEYSDEIPGTVLSQSIESDQEVVASEETITLVVSKGVQEYTLPDFTGMNLNEYTQEAQTLNLMIETKTENSPDIEKGRVIRQSPEVGSTVQKGDKITLVISEGPVILQNKTYTEEIVIPYESVEPGIPQTVEVRLDDYYNDLQTTANQFTITQDKPFSIKLVIEPGGTGVYEVYIDGEKMESLSKTIQYSEVE